MKFNLKIFNLIMQLSHSWKNTNPADYETAKWKLEYLSLFEENLKIFLRR